MKEAITTIAWILGIAAAIAVLWWAIDTNKFDWVSTQYDNRRVYCKESGSGYRLTVDLMHDTGKPLNDDIETVAKDACDLIGGYPG